MNIDVSGKNCLVVGASSGIGLELAKAYVREDANVAMIGSNSDKLDAAWQSGKSLHSKGILLKICADVSDPHQVAQLVDRCGEELGSIDVLANCAGISVSKTIADLDERDWTRVMDVNLKAAYLLAKAVSRQMIDRSVHCGKIINISSIAGKIGEYGNGAYSVSKAGLISLTQVLARELGSHGICVTAVCPGYTDTELLREALRTRAPLQGKTCEEYTAELTSSVPLGRFAEPLEIADLILFLSSDHANYVSGVTLTIDGGKTLI